MIISIMDTPQGKLFNQLDRLKMSVEGPIFITFI